MMNLRMTAAGILTFGTTLSPALAQGTSMTGATGNWMIHTPSRTGCPGLVLHVVRDGNNLKGFAATGDMAAMSRLTGTIDDRQQFTLTMTPVDGKGPQGTITGSRNASDGHGGKECSAV